MTPPALDLFYASHFGHTEKIAHALAEHLATAGLTVRTENLAREPRPTPTHLHGARLHGPGVCVLLAAVRYGRHLPPARRLLAALVREAPTRPLVLLSVNLTARKPGKRSATGSPYLRKWIRRSGARPVLAEAIAGKLEYPRYNAFDRTAIRFIMALTGGPTGVGTVCDYTPWPELPALAARIAAVARRG